ncbi:MAG: hypothetical protein ABI587_15140 [Gemmatimonadales bacterium]
MKSPPLPEQVRGIVERLPPLLREFLDEQLRVGNRILWAHGGHPAPPIGECIMLADQIALDFPQSAAIRRINRNSSLYAAEFTDAGECYFILTPPLAPPPYPDMDAIRAAHDPPEFVVPPPPQLPLDERLELDIRGETLIYHLAGSRCSVEWYHTAGHQIYRSSLTAWFDPVTRRTTPMDREEAELVFARIVALAGPLLGTSRITLCP